MDEYKNLVNQKTSALSSLGNANRQALKYADNTALAQGYATQGARLQNMGNLQNAYLNQVGGVNQQFQQQLGNLENTASTNALTDYVNELSVIASDNSLTQEQVQQRLDNLQNLQYGKLNQQDLDRASYETNKLLDAYNNGTFNNSESDNKEGKYTISAPNGTSANVNFYKGSGFGKNFAVEVDGKTYTVELGEKLHNFTGAGTKGEIELQFKDLKTGEFATYKTNNGTEFIVTKDEKGNIRQVNARAGKNNKQEFKDLLTALGYDSSGYRRVLTSGMQGFN